MRDEVALYEPSIFDGVRHIYRGWKISRWGKEQYANDAIIKSCIAIDRFSLGGKQRITPEILEDMALQYEKYERLFKTQELRAMMLNLYEHSALPAINKMTIMDVLSSYLMEPTCR